jgi:hypothetical protein
MALRFLNSGYFAGKVGIGTESPLSTLSIKGGSEALRFERDSQETYRVLHGTSGLYFSHPNSAALLLGLTQNGDITVSNDQSAEYVRFDNSSSNVGIGTTSPNSKLDIEDSNPFVTIQGSSSSYVNAGVQFISNQASTARGLGNFYYSAHSDVEWFSGLPYNDNDAFVINRNASYTVPSSQSSPPGIGASAGTLLKVSSTGAIQFNNYSGTNETGTPTYLLGTDASGNVVKTNTVPGSGAGPYLPLSAGPSYPLTGDLLTSGNIYLNNNKTIFGKNTSGSNYGLLTITSGNVIKLGAYAYTSAATQIGLGDNGSFLIGSSTVMKIDSSGNVGIGTTSPLSRLHVVSREINNGANKGIRIENYNGTKDYSIRTGVSGSENTSLAFYDETAGANRMVIASGGNVGIGTTNPNHKLDVDGNIGLNQYLYKNGDNDHYIRYTGSKTEIQSPSTIDFRLGANSQPQGGDFQFASDSGDDFTISYTRTGNAVFKQIFSGQAMHWQNNVLDTVYYANNNGNVGIGTTTPGAKLQVGTRGTAGALTPSATDGILFDFHNDGPPYTRHAAIISQAGDASESVIDFWTKEASGTNSKKMTLRGNGNVGIGTASPNSSVKLQVEETGSNAYIRIVETGNTGLDIGQETNGNGIINLRDNKDLRLFTNGSERMRILANGTTLIGSTIDFSNGNADDLQIGNTAGSHGLSIMSQNNAVGSIYFGDNNNNDSGIINYEHGLNQLRFVTNRTQKMVINSSGNVGIGTTSPSEKLDVAGNIKIQAALLSNQDNTDVDTGTETVANVAIATYTAAFFDFVIKKGTNVRSGTVYACHDGTNVEFTETSTQDLGNTSDVTLSVDISGTNMRLRATSLSESWSVKSLIRAI